MAVVADASGLNATASRRLQLAAEEKSVLCLLARPPWELATPSAAQTRWQVSPRSSSDSFSSLWEIELIRTKGTSAICQNAVTRWSFRQNPKWQNPKWQNPEWMKSDEQEDSLCHIGIGEITDKAAGRATA